MKLNRIIRIIMGNKIMILSRLFFFLIPVLVSGPVNAQESRMIRVFFRYGSIPVQGHEDSEYQEVGGFFGGHVQPWQEKRCYHHPSCRKGNPHLGCGLKFDNQI